ncbi:MAG: ATP-binding protein [Cyanobacteriota bacterium]|nr:ATP-binding protein [Cyanobacteriota bacterium]
MLLKKQTPDLYKRRLQLPLRLILVVPLFLQIVAAVGLTGWLSLRNGQKALNEVTSELRTEISDRVRDELWEYIETPHQVNQANYDLIRLGLFELDRLKTMQYHFWQQIQTFDSIDYIQFGTASGEFMAVERVDNQLQIDFADRYTENEYHTYATDSRGNLLGLLKVNRNFNLKQQPWYKIALEKGKPAWSEIYVSFALPKLTMTAVRPVYSLSNELLGVVGSDLELGKINTFLQELKTLNSGAIFIMERSGKIIATSLKEEPFFIASNGKEVTRIEATRLEVPLIQNTAKYLEKEFNDISAINETQQLNFELEEERQFVQVTPLSDGRGIDWLVVAVIPEADFIEQINLNTRNTILWCTLALLVSLLFGLLISAYIRSQIVHLSRATKEVARGQLDKKVRVSGVKELGELAESFNEMLEKLSQDLAEVEKTEDGLEISPEQFRETQLKLIKSEKMSALGSLVAGVGHEINNPVNFLSGNINIAEEYIQNIVEHIQLYQRYFPQPGYTILKNAEDIDLEYLTKDLPDLISSMKLGVERIQNLSKALRTFSRADNVNKDEVNIHEGIDSTLIILKHKLKANQKRPEIEVVKKYGKLPKVKCFAGQMNQVFMNIIANAIDAFDDGNLGKTYNEIVENINRITIRTFVNKEGGNSEENNELEEGEKVDMEQDSEGAMPLSNSESSDYAVISIKDNGPGIPEEVMSRVFDHLFTTKEMGKGTGLGLSISRQIVQEVHGGRLYCVSSPGKGVEFIIEIPIS